ncbi:5029_t:CDS:2 [Paraglomus occultum]|uniref:5029_t:CDS:1 n=1 Tax=Paraglomus occultum TaxID=144539 RepID=A0A9N9BH24_9GLOM|nr:5029_t:CDS:2 [Paraglomus occultum]
MPPKLTPHQFSRGLAYVKQVPTFLQGLVDDDDDGAETSDKLPTTSEDLIDNEDDEILKLSGDEKPQIVVLNERKHMTEEEVQEFIGTQKKTKLTDDESSQNEDHGSQGGKIIFRKPDIKKISANNNKPKAFSKAKSDTSIKDLNEVIHSLKRERASKDETGAGEKSTKKTKRKKKMNNLLSFDSDIV